MQSFFLPVLAVISGFAITLQGQFMGLLDRNLGTRASVFLTYASGGAVVTILVLAGGLFSLRLAAPGLPWYAYSTGILGLIVVGTIGFVIPRMGAARGFTWILASQFLLAALIDHFGLLGAAARPLDLSRLTGLGVMLAGVWLVVR
jgi:transporter family-2 protein